MRKKKRRAIKLKNALILLGIILIIFLISLFYFTTKVTNIYVSGNDFLKEQEVIELCNLDDYPYLYKVSKNKIIKTLKENPFIKNIDIKKKLNGKIYINISEYRILFKDSMKDLYILENGNSVNILKRIYGYAVLTNNVDVNIYDKFISKIKLIDSNILSKISEITYASTELDKERFLLYMNDQNYVYLTLSKFENINNYNEIVLTLDGKHGILYLDSGNHFEIKK